MLISDFLHPVPLNHVSNATFFFQKIHAQFPGNTLVNCCRVVAKLAGKTVDLVIDTDEERKAASYKAFNPTNKFPILETPEGNIQESHAIAKFLAHGHATLLGANAVERAQIDSWLNWVQSGVLQSAMPAFYAILGRRTDVTQAEFNDAVKSIKENCRALDQALTGDWIVGNSVTVADIVLAASLSGAFQLVLDQGFKKAGAKVCAWFERVSALPEFRAIYGNVKMATKSMKPVIKVEEKKPKAAAAAAAAKPAEVKVVNPLDELAKTCEFDLFNFKTFFVNHPDKKGVAVDEMLQKKGKDGFRWWFVHYDKVGTEGQVMYMFQNMLEGFIQRLDGFRKHAFGRVCMTKDEPDLEIKGVLLVRGDVVPQELIDHPQWEYMQARKMDWDNVADMNLVREYMSSKEEGQVNGELCQMAMWHK